MRISWKWLSEMVDVSAAGGPQGLADLLTNRGLEVEAIERQDQGLEKVVSVEILERLPHPQADRLSICNVSLGKGEPLQIVCGAQNMKAGDRVALAQIGALLPNSLKIEQSKIRGVVSNGMLCSEEELKLKEKAEGILILPPSTPLGRPLAEILSRDDTILVFKLTANRGDCLSHWGMAREVAAALGKNVRDLKRPTAKPIDFNKKSPIAIHLAAGDSAPQFFGCLIEGVEIGPSPAWAVKRLEALGTRSINNVVDATNLVMLELGHPTHAYDADRIQGGKIGVRMSRAGESLLLLDGQTVTLNGSELVIVDGADGARPVGLAGVMGGGNSEVQASTTRVFLECAEFSPSLVRKAAGRHQRRTEASHRFERGIDPQGLSGVIARLATLVTELAGGKVVGASAATPKGYKPKQIQIDPRYFEEFLGMTVTGEKAEKILTGLDCQLEKKGQTWMVSVPSYRHDLSIKEDLAEEIARSIGYGEIGETTPILSSAPQSIFAAQSAARLALIDRAKDALVKAGLCETIGYAFTSKAWLTKFGMSSSATLLNPLSEEHEALVPSLIPGLVKNALDNWRHHFGSEPVAIRLFELRPTFHSTSGVKASGEMETGIEERWKLAFAISGPRLGGGLRNELGETDFYDVKAIVESLLESLGTKGVRFQPLSASRAEGPILSLFHPGKSVEVLAGKDVAGYFGLFHPGKGREVKADAPLWICELDWEVLSKLSRPVYESRSFKPWSEFPPMERDFALLVREDVSADKITQLALKAGKPLAKVAKIFDVYKGSQVAKGMTSVAVRVIFYDESRSLQESEAEAASAQILSSWKKELGVELRS